MVSREKLGFALILLVPFFKCSFCSLGVIRRRGLFGTFQEWVREKWAFFRNRMINQNILWE